MLLAGGKIAGAAVIDEKCVKRDAVGAAGADANGSGASVGGSGAGSDGSGSAAFADGNTSFASRSS